MYIYLYIHTYICVCVCMPPLTFVGLPASSAPGPVPAFSARRPNLNGVTWVPEWQDKGAETLWVRPQMLVGGLEHQFFFPRNIGLLIIPIDFHIFQRGGPTTNQLGYPRYFNVFQMRKNDWQWLAPMSLPDSEVSSGNPMTSSVFLLEKAVGLKQTF